MWRGAVVATVGVLLAGGITVSWVAESVLAEAGIFGFSHAIDDPAFFTWMLMIAAALAILMNYFRSHLETWATHIGKKQTLIKIEENDNNE